MFIYNFLYFSTKLIEFIFDKDKTEPAVLIIAFLLAKIITILIIIVDKNAI